MRFRSSGVSQLKNFLSILFGVTFGAIFVLLLATSSVHTKTSLDTRKLSKIGPVRPTLDSGGYLVTVPRLEKVTKKQRVILSDNHVSQAKWTEDIKWPPPWVRTTYTTPSANEQEPNKNVTQGNSFTCDMREITNSLKPALPKHFNSREFHVLPKRYRVILPKPVPSPYCGASGLIFPQKLRDVAQNAHKIWTLFVVKSAPAYEENRMSVRKTWGSPNESRKYGIFVLFVIGKTNNETVNYNLEKESQLYGDILQCDFVDEYHALPIKVLSTFRWILEQRLKVVFVSMTDDDCLVNLARMKYYIRTNVTTDQDYQKKVYCGMKLHQDGKPNRGKTKWDLTVEQYSDDYFPTFCHGGLWILPPLLMKGIYCLSEITDTSDLFLEDVLLTGILREKLNFKDTNIKQMVKRKTPRDEIMLFHIGNDKHLKSTGSKMLTQWKMLRKRWESSVKRQKSL